MITGLSHKKTALLEFWVSHPVSLRRYHNAAVMRREGMTYAEIGEICCVSVARARQLVAAWEHNVLRARWRVGVTERRLVAWMNWAVDVYEFCGA